MSLQIRDGISPEILRLAANVRNRRPILEAMGLEFVSLSKRSFTDASLRVSPWAPLKPATLARKKGRGGILRESGALWHSIRVAAVTENSVTSASDRPYAAIHQFGGQTGRNKAVTLPPRPFFPILNGRIAPEARRRIEGVAKAKALALLK